MKKLTATELKYWLRVNPKAVKRTKTGAYLMGVAGA